MLFSWEFFNLKLYGIKQQDLAPVRALCKFMGGLRPIYNIKPFIIK